MRTTFCTPQSNSPMSPQASRQLLASLVAMEGEAAPSRLCLNSEDSSQETHSETSALESPSTASTVSCTTEGSRCLTAPLGHTSLGYWGRFGTARAQRQLLRCLSREHPCKPPTYRSVHDPFKTGIGGAECRALVPVASTRLKEKNPWCTSTGCRVQN